MAFVLCDADDRIVICNSRYREWFFPGCKEKIRPGLHFSEVVREFMESGLSAQASADPDWRRRRLDHHEKPDGSFEHHLTDGRVFQIHERRTSDGGTVTIHTDVTALVREREAVAEKSTELSVVLESMDQGISMMDRDLTCRVLNSNFIDLLEFPRELGKPGTPFEAFIRYNAERGEYGEGDIEEQVRHRVELARKFEAHCFERTRPDGTVIEIRGKPLPGGGLVTTYTDITERKKAEAEVKLRDRQLTEQIERFDAALSNMTQGLCMFDSERRLVVCNARYLDIYRLPPELGVAGTHVDDILGHRISQNIYDGSDAESYVEERLAVVDAGKPATRIQEFPDGRVIAIVHQPLADGGWIATHEDITELQQIQARMAHMAHHDALTDLPNRVLLLDRMRSVEPMVGRGARFAVLCVDLDRFKNVNDTLGHACGDKVLIAAAERLRSCVRESDIVSRLGGDEFAVLLTIGEDVSEVTRCARRICDTLSDIFEVDGNQVIIGASVGIAVAPDDGRSPDLLLKNADMALYRAKSDGRGVYRFFEPAMDARMQSRRAMELELRHALEKGEFELYYQPVVDIASNTVSGLEALLRWRHPERGFVPPSDFIGVCEEIGLIVPLGDWIIRQACADASNWPHNVRVAVNISPIQFRTGNLVETVFGALASAKIAPNRLELEITESVLLDNNENTLKMLHHLRDMGVRIAMDDFGTGYSSLSYLRKFPFDKIKIDGSFVRDLSSRKDAVAIVNAVASLSKSLGIATTAEGVETEAQRRCIAEAGYTELQGFLFSPPRPASEINAFFGGRASGRSAANSGSF
ncbi:MAG: PAS-domain containing protein [Flavobacteriaceae bacterium]